MEVRMTPRWTSLASLIVFVILLEPGQVMHTSGRMLPLRSSSMTSQVKFDASSTSLALNMIDTVPGARSRMLFAVQATGDLPVEVWLTTGDQSIKLQQQPSVSFNSGQGNRSYKVTINESIKYQQLAGVGAAITDSSAWMISHYLTSGQRNALMSSLFSPSAGIGISYVRLPIGASDFVLSQYTFDDMPPGQTDPELRFFSIDHDKPYIIPIIRQALSLNPRLKFLASPWSPPAWMKARPILGGSYLLRGNYQTYANYFVKFIQAYQAEGIPIHAVTVQNEPHFVNISYPTMYMESSEQADFVKGYLGPAFVNAGLDTKILVWDHNWNEPGYPLAVLNDVSARAFVAGSAWHCYAGNPSAQSQVHDAYPDKDIYFTECSGDDRTPDFAPNLVWFMQNIVIGTIRNWAKSVILWNLALDEFNGPHIGGCEGCRGVVTISTENHTVNYEVEYYVLGHVSKFMTPGAYRIASDTYNGVIETVAFLNPDSYVVVVLNPTASWQAFDVQWGGRYFSYSLPAESVATFKWGRPVIGGRVTSSNGLPVAGVTISAHDNLSTTTSVAGNYSFTNLVARGYSLTPSRTGFSFLPPLRTVTVPPDSFNESFVMVPSPVSITLTLSNTVNLPASLTYYDTQGLTTTLDFLAGAVTRTTTIVLTPTLATGGAGFAFAGHAFELDAFQDGNPQPGFIFSVPVTVMIHYSSDDVRVVKDKNELVLSWWTGSGWQDAAQTCDPASPYTRDVAANVLSVPICHVSQYGLFGPTYQVSLPFVAHEKQN
jgi:glucosylceramidase